MAKFPALLEIDTGLENESDVVANQIAAKLDLGLTPRLPAVIDGSSVGTTITGIPAVAAAVIENNSVFANKINAKLQKNLDIGNEQAKAMADAIVANVNAAKTIALQADNAILKAQNQTIEIREALGGFAAQLDRAKDAREFEIQIEALAEKRADILDDKHTGIGIIDSVINGFRVQKTESKLKTTLQENAVNQQAILDSTATTEAASKTNALVKRTANESTVLANQKQISSAGEIELYNATMVQNRSNADTLQSMLANNSKVLSNTMAGFVLQSSEENRKLRREQHQLALRQDIRATTRDEIAIRRSRIAEQRERIAGVIEGRTANAKEQSILTSLQQQELALDQAILNLSESVATSDDRIASALLSRTQAETNLDISNLAFEKAQDDAENPEVTVAAKAKRDADILSLERAKFEFDELQNQADLRLAGREGSVEAQGLQNRLALIQAEGAEALAAGNKALALAKLAEAERLRIAKEEVRINNAENVREYQSKLFGAHAMESADVINDKLDNKNPAYMMMRQLNATGKKGELLLGSDPAKSMAFLDQLEASGIGVISNDITPIRILREVRAILQKVDEDNPQAAAALTESARAIRFNKTAREYMEANEKETLWNDVTNPLMPPTIPQLIELSKPSEEGEKAVGVAAQPLFSKVLIPNGNVDANPDEIISSGIIAMQAGTISLEQLTEGIVVWGNSIAINNNINHHGMPSIGLPHQTKVNMRVMRPRGRFASVLDTFSTAIDKAIIPTAVGAITIGGAVLAPTSAGISLPAAGAFGAAVGGLAHKTGVGAGGIGLQGSDTVILTMSDPIAVRQYLIAILSSSTLGGENTEDILDAADEGE